jgi:MFS family permease
MSDRLGLGYLEVPPLPAFVLAIVRFFLGTSFLSLHIVPALIEATIIFITALIVKKLEGNLFALILSLVCVTLAPIYIGHSAIFTYDIFDQLFWILSIYFIVMIITTENKQYWIYFGIAAGFGLLSKITILYLGLGVFLAFLLTKDRKKSLNKQFIIAGIIAFLIALPFIIWQVQNKFPLIEYFKNYTAKVEKMNPIKFMVMQIIVMNPIASITWILGLFYFLFHKQGKKFKVFGLIYIFIAIIFMLQQTKYYLLTSYYPILFAGGATFFSNLIASKKINWLKPVYVLFIILFGLILMPIVRPVISPEALTHVLNKVGLSSHSGSSEMRQTGALPQQLADMFGWEDMTQKVAKIYNSLSDEEKKNACILTENYGEAGAIHFYKNKYNLPEPICGHNIFYFWGTRNNTGRVAIIIGMEEKNKEELEKYYQCVTIVARGINKYSMPDENENPIFLCKNIRVNLRDIWIKLKHFG